MCIFKKDEAVTTQFVFLENSALAELCSIPLINFEKYLTEPDLILQTDMQFYANGASLLEKGMKPACDVLEILLGKLNYIPKIIFPHSVSEKIIQQAFDNANLNLMPYSTFSELGNLATVSIPSAITKGFLNGQVKNGDKCIAWVASAGMKFSAIEIAL